MKAVFSMWKNTRMIVLTAVCAAVYGAALIAFKTAIPLIPGITEVRVGNILPMPFGLLFGPAGAWGAAFGNLIGDLLGGTLSPGSAGGFLGNFLLAYLPYALWTQWIPFHQKTREWIPRGSRPWITYFLVAFISGGACAVVIATVVELLGIVPYRVLSKIIAINNTVAAWIGVILLTTVFGFIKDGLQLFWPEVLGEEDIGRPIAGPLGAWVVCSATLFGLFGESFTSLGPLAVGGLSSVFILMGCLIL